VAQRYDAGVRSGEQVAKDMIAVRIGPDLRMAVVGAPSYFKNRPEPKKPQDLIGHNCINLRLPKHDSVYAWEFDKNGRELRVRVEGQLTFNATSQQINAALAGLKAWFSPTPPRANCDGCLTIGASPTPVTTCSILAAASPQPHFRWSSMRCDTVNDVNS
jgi:LysR substrate binding domain